MCEAFDDSAAMRVRGVPHALRHPDRPFVEFEFMRRALVGTLALALGAGRSACS
jgi:hypothetical protein